jgi:hypothetical protein
MGYKKSATFRLDLTFDLIQSIRLVHALLESSYDVRIPKRHLSKTRNLERVFGIDVKGGGDAIPALPGLEIQHEGLPLVRVGSIERPLIFARGMVDHCRSLWDEERPTRACFAGRLHEDRRRVLRQWMQEQFPENGAVEMPDQAVVDRRVRLRKRVKGYAKRILRGPLRPLRGYVRVPTVERRTRENGVVFMVSDRGWCHPTKTWDPSYFRLLASSKFVLCPDGRYVWTYRFFEAVMCGAIPIVQNECPLYDGYRYYTMDDALEEMEWTASDARHNQNLCRERMTIPPDQLDAEIGRLVDQME